MKIKIKFFSILLVLVFSTNCTSTKDLTSNEQMPSKEVGSTGKVTFMYQNQTVTYSTVRAADGKVWLQQNLGSANVARSITDKTAYGDFYAWGRWSDGHERRDNPQVSKTTAKPNNPLALSKDGQNPFYAYPRASGYWWFEGTSQDLWLSSSTKSVDDFNGCDPCKQLMGKNWRLASNDEWERVLKAEKINDYKSAYNSNLKIPLAGYRSGADGAINNENKLARFWTNTSSNKGNAYLVNITGKGIDIPAYSRSGGLSIRCIKK